MGWHRTGLIGLLLVLLACSDEVLDGTEGDTPEAAENAEAEADAPALFDDEGNLLESDQRLAGLTLPRGLAPQTTASDREHAFHAPEVEVEAMLGYFGPRLTTGIVERVGAGAFFREAVPHEARGGTVKLDVGVFPSRRGGSRLSIVELPPPPAGIAPGQEDPARLRTAEQALRSYD